MKGELVQIVLIIFLIMLGAAVAQGDASVIIVNNSGEGNYTSIQEAVRNAQNGDTILVSPGVYRENIKVDKELTILSYSTLSGSQTDRTYVIGAMPGNAVFNVSTSNVTIEGFHIAGDPSGTDKYGNAGLYLESVRNCSLRNNTLMLNDLGIVLKNSQGTYLEGNLVSLGSKGITLDNSEGNVLSDNLVMRNDQGVSLNNSFNNTLINNTADSNEIGIFLKMSQGNELAYNLVLKNKYGIRGHSAGTNILTGNNLYLNDVGVHLSDSSNNSLYGNEFINVVNAIDEGRNIWNSSSAGNFWGNHERTEADENGIIGTPYIINSTGGAADYMPLVNRLSSDDSSQNRNIKGNTLSILFNKKYPPIFPRTQEKGVVIETTELEQINKSLDEGPVFLRLGAEWCSACQSMRPILDELAAEYGENATIMSININQNIQLATYFDVGYIPDSTVIMGIENGKYIYMQPDGNITTDRVSARIVGLQNKDEYEKVLKHALAYEEKRKTV
jgi:nitrous oxidase accessory protein